MIKVILGTLCALALSGCGDCSICDKKVETNQTEVIDNGQVFTHGKPVVTDHNVTLLCSCNGLEYQAGIIQKTVLPSGEVGIRYFLNDKVASLLGREGYDKALWRENNETDFVQAIDL